MGFKSRGRRQIALFSTLIIAGTVFLGFAPTASTAPTDPTADGLANFGSCYERNQLAAVNLLIDESGSLEDTDPNNKRVELAKALVATFSQLATTEGSNGLRIDLAVNGFGSDYKKAVDWITLTTDNYQTIAGQIETFKDRNKAQDTDYVVALDNARYDVIQHSAIMSPTDPSKVCRLVAWFTDGELSLSREQVKRNGYTKEEAERRICNPGGLADATRSADVFLLTAALTSKNFGPLQEQLLKSITDGTAFRPSGGPCGDIVASPYGLYSSDGNFVDLLTKLIPPLGGTPIIKKGTGKIEGGDQGCQPKCVWSTTVESLATGLKILVDSRPSGGSLNLIGPSSTTDILQSTVATTTPDGAIRSQEILGLRQISVVFAKRGSGNWSIEYKPSAPSVNGTLTVWAAPRFDVALKPSMVGKWERGTESVARFTLVSRDGKPLSAGQVDNLTLTGTTSLDDGATQKDLPVLTDDKNNATASASFTINDAASRVLVTASGSFTTTAGTVVPVSASIGRTILVARAPNIVGVFDLGIVRAGRSKTRDKDNRQKVLPKTATGNFKIKAGAAGGTVCLEDSKSITVGSKKYSLVPIGKNCVDLGANATLRLKASVRIEKPSAGQIRGNIALTTQANEAGSEKLPLSVAARGEIIIDPPTPFTDTGRASGLILLGILLPLLLWIISAWWLAAFNKTSVPSITATSVNARITPNGVDFDVPNGAGDVPPYITSDGPRMVSFHGVDVKAPIRLMRPQDAIAKQSGMTMIGSLGSGSRLRPTSARIGHQLQSQWIFAVANGTIIPDGGDIEGTLYLLSNIESLTADQGPGGLHERARKEVAQSYETIVERLSKPQRSRSRKQQEEPLEDFSSPNTPEYFKF